MIATVQWCRALFSLKACDCAAGGKGRRRYIHISASDSVCDSNIVTEQLEIMSGQISLPMEVLSEEDTAEIAAADLTGILFALEQALFTSSGRQCLSMVLASLGISFVACVSTAYTGSFLPRLLEHECFLVFYFGRFRYY